MLLPRTFRLAAAFERLCRYPQANFRKLASIFLPDPLQLQASCEKLLAASMAHLWERASSTTFEESSKLRQTKRLLNLTSVQELYHAVLIWLTVLSDHRSLAADAAQLVPSLILLEFLLRDELDMQDPEHASLHNALALAALCDRLARYLVSTISMHMASTWTQETIQGLLSSESPPPADTSAGRLLQDFLGLKRMLKGQTVSCYAQRVYQKYLELLLDVSDTSEQGAETWLQAAQKLQYSGKTFCLIVCLYMLISHPWEEHAFAVATLAALPKHLTHSAKLQRYQSEVAVALTGVSTRNLQEKGLALLELLQAAAPAQTSDEHLLPVQRATFVIRALQKWLDDDSTSAEGNDFDDALAEPLLKVMTLLVPVLQNVPGSHWGFMFDVAELCIEVSTAYMLSML